MASNSAAGIFITLEGGEGTGKTTLIRTLSDWLTTLGLIVVSTREPGGTPLAESVRRLALNPPEGTSWSPMAEALLMNAARRDHVEKLIAPALADGAIVLCDRFADSTRVYQGVCSGVAPELIRQMESHVLGFTRPQLTLILDIPVELAALRRAARGAADVFEARPQSFHEAVRQAFLGIAASEPHRCRVLDASLAPAELAAEAKDIITRLLPSMPRACA